MEEIIIKTIMFVGTALVVLGLIGAGIETGHVTDLKNQCIADGHKEYECYSMLHGRKK